MRCMSLVVTGKEIECYLKDEHSRRGVSFSELSSGGNDEGSNFFSLRKFFHSSPTTRLVAFLGLF